MLTCERLQIQSADNKGQGVFLKQGITIAKDTNVMIYGGRACDRNPHNDFCYKKVRNCFTALFVVRHLLLLTLLQAAEPDDDFRVNELQGKRDHRAKCVLCGVSLP